MSVLERLPGLATTGVGSLPFDAPEAAVRHATRAYVLPFCPQLPRHDGDMVSEWLGAGWAGATGCGWTSERDRERPVAWDALLVALAERDERAAARGRAPADVGAPVAGEGPVAGGRSAVGEHRLVKLQVTGPVTLAVALERSAGRTGCGRPVVELAAEIGHWLAANASTQIARLTAAGYDAVLVVDEPGLVHAGLGPDDVGVWDPLRAAAAAWGLHVCSQVPWAVVRAAEPDLLSFDVTRYAVGGEGAAVIAALIDGGGHVAWGALDPVTPDGVGDLLARVASAIGAVTAAGTSVERLFSRSLLTPSCGTGRLSPDRERLVASLLDAGAGAAAAAWRAWPSLPVRP